MRVSLLWLAVAAGLLSGCGEDAAGSPDSSSTAVRHAQSQPIQVPPQSHDFGKIPHGQAAYHDFVIDTRKLADDLVCLGVRLDCSCAHYKMLLRDAQGQEREINGQPRPEFAAREGEVLVIRMQIDTAQKEAVNLPPTQSRATVVLQHCKDPDPSTRIEPMLLMRYAVDSPVKVKPFAILDFETVPQSAPRTLQTWLASDLPGTAVKFGPATCDDPRVELELRPDGDSVELRATFTPDAKAPPGMFKSLVRVATDLPGGYELHLAAVGKVIPDLEAQPMAKLSLGQFDFQKPGAEHFVNVYDHDRRRPAEFVVARFVDGGGRDASRFFAVRQVPLDGDDRGFRVFVRYLGGLQPPSFRGELVLAKDHDAGPFLPIEVVAFHRGTP